MRNGIDVEAWLDRAVVVEEEGLDLGFRRRVGVSRFEGGVRIVTALDGLETRFPNRRQGRERPLDGGERAAVAAMLERNPCGGRNDEAV